MSKKIKQTYQSNPLKNHIYIYHTEEETV